jgi:hypothetical protein
MTSSVRKRLARGLQQRLNIPYTAALRHVNALLDSGCGWELPPLDPDAGWMPAVDALAESYLRAQPETTR